MPNVTALEELLVNRGLSIVGPVIMTDESDPISLVFVKAHFDNKGRRVPSSYFLNRIAGEALNLGFRVQFVIIEGERNDLDSSLKSMLLGKFPNLVRNSFASFNRNEANVWIEPKRSLPEIDRQAIKESINQFLDLFKIVPKTIGITQSENLPTLTAILKVLRIVAPCSSTTLASRLIERKFIIPNDVWLSHALDKLRKTKLLIRNRKGDYLLSLHGLAVLGTEKSRRSPDIVRALALTGKRE